MSTSPEYPLPETLQYPPDHIDESLAAILGLSTVFHGRDDKDAVLARMAQKTYGINMPDLSLVPDTRKQVAIAERAKAIVVAPYRQQVQFTERQQIFLQTLLDGLALGMKRDAIAQLMGIGGKPLWRLSKRLYNHLEVSSQAGAMYSMMLHGYTHSVMVPAGRRPDWSTRARKVGLHFYLGELGMTAKEAATLTDTTPTVVRNARLEALRAFGAVRAWHRQLHGPSMWGTPFP